LKEEQEKAENKLSTAKLPLANKKYEDAVSRAYYSMFNTGHALLREHDIAPRTHSGTASKLGQLFKDRIERSLISDFTRIQQLREDADYGLETEIDSKKARNSRNCRRIYAEIQRGTRG
jgi:uncharacterized protein (UPF0332 family)